MYSTEVRDQATDKLKEQRRKLNFFEQFYAIAGR